MIKEIVTDYDVLSVRSEEINTKKDGDSFRSLLMDLKDTIVDKELLALSGPQIGIPARVFTINFNKRRKAFINPIVTEVKQFTFSRETTPSIPDKEFMVPRYGKIQATYQDPMGQIQTANFVGASAYIFQQMMDFLDGVLPCDIGFELDEDWDKASDDEKAELLQLFSETLDMKMKNLREDIEKDKNLSKMEEGVEFIKSVREGDTEVENVELTEEEVELLKKHYQESEREGDEPSTD